MQDRAATHAATARRIAVEKDVLKAETRKNVKSSAAVKRMQSRVDVGKAVCKDKSRKLGNELQQLAAEKQQWHEYANIGDRAFGVDDDHNIGSEKVGGIKKKPAASQARSSASASAVRKRPSSLTRGKKQQGDIEWYFREKI